ncbi:hypothetical protein RhiirA5_402055 [Rhizophagus irregularis]|uniref:Uncharacterized protein n=1 Tax=Rhizophagus irregularis TaxID=588596 RepID=A0A2N0P8P2_9GLOM|nr:hypothetical protein RhiirA5_402055 [Rhizophagus irregularis]
MYWSRSLLLYKTSLLISLFTTFVLSCSPEVNNGDVFSINQSNTNTRLQLNPRDAANSDNQRFSIDCAKCNIQSNSTDWTIYHTSCSITNKSSNLCMNSEGPNNTLARSSCEYATKWDLWGRASIDSACSSSTGSACSCPTDSAVLSPTDSAGGFVATVLGSILGTGLITLATSYWFIQRKRIYPGHALNT